MQTSRFGGLAAVVAAMVLAGCGGGSSSSTVTVSGVAATGAAIASGAVTLKCASGTSYSATTGTDGKFSIDVANGALPCIAQVAYTDGTGAKKLRTIVTTAGIANITPITELVLAKLSGGTAANAFDNFNAATVKGYTAADVTAAVAAVKTYISGLGVSVTNFPDDPIGAKFVPASGSTSGDAVDAILDALKIKLAANGTTLDQAVAAVSAGGGGSSTPGTLTASAASVGTRNGNYTMTGGTFTSGSDSGFNGSGANGQVEMEVVWASNATIKRAHVWFYGSNSSITTFGCDGAGISCAGVSYEPLLKQVKFTNVAWHEVIPDLTGTTPDALVPSGETLTLNGTISAP